MTTVTNCLYNFIAGDSAPRQIFFYTTPIVSFTMKFLHAMVYDIDKALGDFSEKKIQEFNLYKTHYESYIQTGMKIQLLIAGCAFFLIPMSPVASFVSTLFLVNGVVTYVTSKIHVRLIADRRSFDL